MTASIQLDKFLVLPNGERSESVAQFVATAIGSVVSPTQILPITKFHDWGLLAGSSLRDVRCIIVLGHGEKGTGTLLYGKEKTALPAREFLAHIRTSNFNYNGEDRKGLFERFIVQETLAFDDVVSLFLAFKDLSIEDRIPVILASCYSHVYARILNQLNSNQTPFEFFGLSTPEEPVSCSKIIMKGIHFYLSADFCHQRVLDVMQSLKDKTRSESLQWLRVNLPAYEEVVQRKKRSSWSKMWHFLGGMKE